MSRLAQGERLVPVVDGVGHLLGGLTPLALARAYAQVAGGQASAAAQTCRAYVEELPTLPATDRIRDRRTALLRGGGDEFLVVTEDGHYLGTASRQCLLEPPRARLILVDHNELSQAVPGADEAEIVGVLDHHRLGNAPTAAPIPFVVEPVGSTSTLVAEACRRRGVTPPADIAGLLLSGILSDTLVFRSPDRHGARPSGRRLAGGPQRRGDRRTTASTSSTPPPASRTAPPRTSWTATAKTTRWPTRPSAWRRWK